MSPRDAALASIAVVIVNYRTSSQAIEALRTVAATDGAELVRAVVVDNSVDPIEAADLLAAMSEIRELASLDVVVAPSNLGYARGNNLGYRQLATRYGEPDLVVVMNPDVRIVGGDFRQLLAECGGTGAIHVAATVGKQGYTHGLSRLERATGRSVPYAGWVGDGRVFVYPNGHFLCIPGGVWTAMGGFNPAYFLYCEEIDLLLRSRSAQRQITSRVATTMRVAHRGAASTGDGNGCKSLVTLREACRSRVILYRRHVALRPWLVPMVSFRLLQAVAYLVRWRQASARAVIGGLVDGLMYQPGGGET
jgi:N-acetylglucosaminyl-diphospho-decaprenol L-rhamnosyltransferase